MDEEEEVAILMTSCCVEVARIRTMDWQFHWQYHRRLTQIRNSSVDDDSDVFCIVPEEECPI